MSMCYSVSIWKQSIKIFCKDAISNPRLPKGHHLDIFHLIIYLQVIQGKRNKPQERPTNLYHFQLESQIVINQIVNKMAVFKYRFRGVGEYYHVSLTAIHLQSNKMAFTSGVLNSNG